MNVVIPKEAIKVVMESAAGSFSYLWCYWNSCDDIAVLWLDYIKRDEKDDKIGKRDKEIYQIWKKDKALNAKDIAEILGCTVGHSDGWRRRKEKVLEWE